MIDTHCHLTSSQFASRVDQVLADALATGVHGCITVATTTADSLRGLELALQHANVWSTAGVHPLHSDEPADWEQLRAVARDSRCVAWGELGLDHHYTQPARTLQLDMLERQLDLLAQWRAAEPALAKPIIVHCRDAFDDLLAIFRRHPFPADRFVFHCFTGGPDEARKVLDFGAWISFTGVVTFHNAPEVAAAARIVPADRIMVETDAPFLSPEPVRKVRPNEPKFVTHIAARLAELRGITGGLQPFEQVLDANARNFFGLPGVV